MEPDGPARVELRLAGAFMFRIAWYTCRSCPAALLSMCLDSLARNAEAGALWRIGGTMSACACPCWANRQ